MANSLVITDVKNNFIERMVQNELLINAFGVKDITIDNADDMINKCIFTYNQNPYVIYDVKTFLTVQVHIPEEFRSTEELYVYPKVEIWIYSHQENMLVSEIPNLKMNRNDYISTLLDEMFNGNNANIIGGIGKIKLLSNIEGAFQSEWLYRQMFFKTKVLNDALCDRKD